MKKDLFLIIDMQNVYGVGGQWNCPGSVGAAERIRQVIRDKGDAMDVIFTEFRAAAEPRGVWKDYNTENARVNADAWSNEMMEVFDGDLKRFPLYTKSTYSSLTIPAVLYAAREAERVVVAGVVAECCVLATVMGLIDEGIPVIYLTDAVAGIDSDTEAAVERILSGLEPLHVRRMTSEQYLKNMF